MEYISFTKLKCAKGERHTAVPPALGKATLSACSAVSQMCVPEDVSNTQLLWDCCSVFPVVDNQQNTENVRQCRYFQVIILAEGMAESFTSWINIETTLTSAKFAA